MRDPADDDQHFEDAIARAFGEARRRKGACPDLELLSRFHERELSSEAAAEIQKHVDLCGRCDLLLEKMREFDEAGSAAAEPKNWPQVERRLTKKLKAFVRAQGSGRQRGTVGWFVFLLLGYAIAVLLAYPAYLGMTRGKRLPQPNVSVSLNKTETPTPAPPFSQLPVVDLNIARGASGGPTVLALGNSPDFLLTFFMPVHPASRYTVSVVRTDNSMIVPATPLIPSGPSGNFFLLCKRQYFPPGGYDLTVTVTSAKTSRKTAEYKFHFRV